MIVSRSFGVRFVCIQLIVFEICVKEKKKEERRRKKNKIEIFAFDFLDCEEK